ncbi:type II toxin-antitoxin system mRNA interferase toxin, RelE/StbE family [Helicobacter sp. 23-1044]
MATKYTIHYGKKYKKAIKKFDDETLQDVKCIVEKLANDEILDAKHKDHKLKGAYSAFRECHIRPNLCLIYQKIDNLLILILLDIGSHSDLGLTS